MDAWRIVSPNGKWDIIIIGYSFPKTDMKSLLPFHVNWTNKTDFQLWWTISDVATAGHSMAQIMTTVATAQVWVLTMNFYRCSECKSKCWAQKDKQQTPDRTPTSRWGCWRRWRGWWGPGRRHTAARGGRRPQRSSLSAARAASFLVTGSTPGHWEALRDRWRRAAGHPGTWRSRRGHSLIIHLKTQMLVCVSHCRSDPHVYQLLLCFSAHFHITGSLSDSSDVDGWCNRNRWLMAAVFKISMGNNNKTSEPATNMLKMARYPDPV